MEIIWNSLPVTKKELKAAAGPIISLLRRPEGLQDRKGGELLAPFVQKSLSLGSLSLPFL